MDDAMLRADCARCAALCCVSLAFDRSELFAFDKAAGEICLHLTSGHQCRIHRELSLRGFGGCARYDCYGAGQRVTQEVFGGRSWREHPALARPMFDGFRVMREVHEWLLLLHMAGRLPLTPRQSLARADLQNALQPHQGWSPDTLAAFERSHIPDEVRAFLVTLKDKVSRVQRPRHRLPVVVE